MKNLYRKLCNSSKFVRHSALIILILTLFAINGFGQKHIQSVNKDTSVEKKSHWVAEFSYLSDNVYQGRKDSIAAPYITPSIGYYDKTGLFISTSFSYLPAEGRFDLITVEGGYSYTSNHFNARLSAAKDFYSNQSYAVTSEIQGRVSAYLAYDFGFFEPSVELGASFGDSYDAGIDLGVEHYFSLMNDQLALSPSIHVIAGTENYYANYYKNRKYSPNRKKGSVTNVTNAIVNGAENFQLKDYEFSIPIEYSLNKKFKLNFSPTYAIPVNPSVVTIETKSNGSSTSQTTTESLNNVFYFSVGFSYTF